MLQSLQYALRPAPVTINTATSSRFKPILRVPYHGLKVMLRVRKPARCITTWDALVEQDKKRTANGRVEDELLPFGLRREAVPRHVAVIMDGNRRWARMRGLPAGSGYEAGVRSLKAIVELCCKWGIRVLSVFAFSSDNWFRPKVEVEFLMGLFGSGVQEDTGVFLRENIRVSVIGDLSKLPVGLQEMIVNLEVTTKSNNGFHLIVAVSYSGKYDIVQACQRIALKVNGGLIEPNDINESLIEQELETKCCEFPCPDLLIRTGGELRVSNFMLWQLAYTELFFAQSLWPDFGEAEFSEALQSFQRRQRRYGRCSS